VDNATTAFFSGQYEGIWLVLEALYDFEENQLETKHEEISREWVTRKLESLMLNDFTNGILNTYLPIKEEK
jgi:hypothetical protein